MSDEFDRELSTSQRELEASREELLEVLGDLTDADLERGRRGGWTVKRVLEHVIQSEWLYSRLVSHLRGQPVAGDVVSGALTSVDDADQRLNGSRTALLEALHGVDEESFYQLREVGHEEYSILSVLENQINHDREHAAQVQAIVEDS